MATDQLALYNLALASIGGRMLDTLSEQREERRALDKIWNAGAGAVTYCLGQGYWDHAMKQSSSTAASTGDFDFNYFHNYPSDLVKLSGISADQNFSCSLERYEIQTTSIKTDEDTLYLRYVSNSTTAGGNLAIWPETFTRWVGTWLGLQIAPTFLKDGPGLATIARLEMKSKRMLLDARSKDAQQDAQRTVSQGTWLAVRGSYTSRDGGNRGSLIG